MLSGIANSFLPAKELETVVEEDTDEYDTSSEMVDEIEKSLEEKGTKTKRKRANPSSASKKHKFSIQKTVMKNIVKEMIGADKSIANDALEVIRVAAEKELIDFFEKAQSIAQFNERKTVSIVDVHCVKAAQSTTHNQLRDVIKKNNSYLETLHEYRAYTKENKSKV